MDSKILQNPVNLVATYREKAGKQHRGYVTNVTKISGENENIVIDYQYETNTYSDSQFLQYSLKGMGKQEEEVTVVTDEVYARHRSEELTEKNNVRLVHTNLTGRETEDILADFAFNEEGNKVLKCPGGFEPKSCNYNQNTGQCVISFQCSQCEQCPIKSSVIPKCSKG